MRPWLLGLPLLAIAPGCRADHPPSPRTLRSGPYTITLNASGWRERVAHDADGDGRPEVVLHLSRDGRIQRAEIDSNDDGKIDRWEWHRPDGSVETIAHSLRDTGRPDEWMFPDAHGGLRKRGVDQDGDGQADHWESFEGSGSGKPAAGP